LGRIRDEEVRVEEPSMILFLEIGQKRVEPLERGFSVDPDEIGRDLFESEVARKSRATMFRHAAKVVLYTRMLGVMNFAGKH
jgi:hypothetical protein